MTMVGNADGRLHVQRQVDDYALRSVEFEMMGFLAFTVETYERRIEMENKSNEQDVDEASRDSTINRYGQYLTDHPKASTHTRVYRPEDHNCLPNIIGPWLPRRDGEENTKAYYYASMLAFLKPWRDLRDLKDACDTWKDAFDKYMQNATQRDRDVVAGCQYYYDTRTQRENRDLENDPLVDVDMHEENEIEGGGDDDEVVEESMGIMVSFSFRIC